MDEVIFDPPRHVPLWSAAVRGQPDWAAAYAGYRSAVDWPTAAFWRELATIYPEAKVILTIRSPESWYGSFSETIFKLLAARDQVPPEMAPFLEMGSGVVAKTGFAAGAGREEIIKSFNAHNDAVRSAIAADRLLVYQVKEGWAPLCRFLGQPVPDAPFPNTNSAQEFWERLSRPPHAEG
jgi:hypothetical protein